MESEDIDINVTFEIGEQIDCKDTVNKWLNAEIIARRDDGQYRVHYTQWSQKYDEWIYVRQNKMLKQWKSGNPIQINNRIDVQYVDKNLKIGKWLEAIVLKIDEENPNKVFIHFIDYKQIYDQWVYLTDKQRVAEVGTNSQAHGAASLQKSNPKYQKSQKEFIKILKQKEQGFKSALADSYNWQIYEVDSDGNCLFRSISHQIYGTEDYHSEIRQCCMDYIQINRNYFEDFIIGGDKNFEDYIAWKRTDAVWGDNIEIQAIREIYERPVEIYAYSNTPMRTFSESSVNNQKTPIRLSYHGQSHYNSINTNPQLLQQNQGDDEQSDLPAQPLNNSQSSQQSQQSQQQSQQQQSFGKIEKQALEIAKQRIKEKQEEQKQQELQNEGEIRQARRDFEKIGMWNLDEAIKESFNMYQEKNNNDEQNLMEDALTRDAIQQVENQIESETNNAIEASRNQFEDQQLQQIQEQSLREQEEMERQRIQDAYYENQLKQVTYESSKDYNDQINQVLLQSINEFNNNASKKSPQKFDTQPQQFQQQNQFQQNYSQSSNQSQQGNGNNFYLVGDPMENMTILQVLNNDLNMDISLKEAIQAYEIYGESPQEIIAYFCEKKL